MLGVDLRTYSKLITFRDRRSQRFMSRTDKRKQSLYFPEDMLKEIQIEANRQDRSLSWIVQQAWRIARNEIMRFPSVNDHAGDEHGE